MRYAVIYTIDTDDENEMVAFIPTDFKKWNNTESYDNQPGEMSEYMFHRKYCRVLNQAEFDEFVGQTGMYASDIETMGAIGQLDPFGDIILGLSPAISFDNTDGTYLNAYVTPYIENAAGEPEPGYDWETVRDEIITKYKA